MCYEWAGNVNGLFFINHFFVLCWLLMSLSVASYHSITLFLLVFQNLMQLPTISGSIEVWDFLSVDSQVLYFILSLTVFFLFLFFSFVSKLFKFLNLF